MHEKSVTGLVLSSRWINTSCWTTYTFVTQLFNKQKKRNIIHRKIKNINFLPPTTSDPPRQHFFNLKNQDRVPELKQYWKLSNQIETILRYLTMKVQCQKQNVSSVTKLKHSLSLVTNSVFKPYNQS